MEVKLKIKSGKNGPVTNSGTIDAARIETKFIFFFSIEIIILN